MANSEIPLLDADNRSDWARLLAATGEDLLRDTRHLVRLEADELLECATRASGGLTDFGPDDFREPFAVLLQSLEKDSKLTLIGRTLVRSELLNLLENRLKIADLVKRKPGIRDEKVERPLFIVGLPRSGTTILHELIAQDPELRAPLTWEGRFPCPPSSPETYTSDPRIAAADRIFDLWIQLVPEFQTMTEMGALLPCECIQLTAHSFRSEEFLGRQQTAGYGAWLATADLAPAYAYHRLMLQMFQSGMDTQRWILKAPSHMGAMPALLAEYPDACIVQTHRDPLQSMASTGSLLAAHAWMRASEVDVDLIKLGFAGEGMASRLDQLLDARDRHPNAATQFADVRFADLMKRPIETLRAVYTKFDLEFTTQHEQRIEAYLAAKPRAKHGRHEYRIEELGVDLAEERARFRAYQERFSVPSEI
jgi:hypothetical protein